MKSTTASVALLCTLVFLGGCARTVYTSLSPNRPAPHQHPGANQSTPDSWVHFFVLGWSPSEVVIDAAQHCGGGDHIEAIRTEQNVAQAAIVLAIASAITVPIYSPYDAKVQCDYHIAR